MLVVSLHDCLQCNPPCTSFSSHLLPFCCELLPPVMRPLLWMIVPSSVTAANNSDQLSRRPHYCLETLPFTSCPFSWHTYRATSIESHTSAFPHAWCIALSTAGS